MTFTDLEEKQAEKVVSKKSLAIPTVVDLAKTFKIVSQEAYKEALGYCREVKAFIKEAEAYWADDIKRAHELHKSLKKKETDLTTLAKDSEIIWKFKMNEWDEKVKREQKLIQDAITARQKAEADKLRAKAEKLAEHGKESQAQALQEQAQMVESIAPTAPEAPKEEGVSTRYKYTAVIEDLKALDRQWMMPNQKLLDSTGQATEGTMVIPGVKWVKTPIMAIR